MQSVQFGTSFSGIEIIENPALTIRVEDWSKVRSPSRARRRRKRGFPQNIVVKVIPDPKVYMFDQKAVMHPDMARALRERLSKSLEDKIDRQFNDAIYGLARR